MTLGTVKQTGQLSEIYDEVEGTASRNTLVPIGRKRLTVKTIFKKAPPGRSALLWRHSDETVHFIDGPTPL